MRLVWAFTAGAFFLGAVTERPARAQSLSWQATLSGPVPSAPTTDMSFNTANPSVYVGQGTTIRAFQATSNTLRWSKDLSPTSLANFPSPVPLKSGKRGLFFTSNDGQLFAYDVTTPPASGQVPALLWATKSLRRASCTADQVTATPAVQLYNYSNSAFQAAAGDDLIFVPTRYACSTTSANVVYAIKASTGDIAWTFNSGATYALDFAAEGCTIDYSNNRLYCGFNQPSGGVQNTLYALSTATTNSAGQRVWAVNVGSVRTRPAIRNGKVYVATYSGYVQARNAATGAAVWGIQVSSTYPITRNPLVESRASSPFANAILVVDSNGTIYHLDDTKQNALVWSLPGFGASSMVVSAPFSQRLYVGKNDGSLHELKYATGIDAASVGIQNSSTVYDSSIINVAGQSLDGDRIFTVGSGALALYTMPFVPYNCNGVVDCVDVGSGGGSYSCDNCANRADACFSAACVSNACVIQPRCANTCCYGSDGRALSCSDLNSDPNNCGACGMVCPAGTTCQSGSCVCDPTACASLGGQFACNSAGNCACTPTTAAPDTRCGAGTSDGCGGYKLCGGSIRCCYVTFIGVTYGPYCSTSDPCGYGDEWHP